MNNEENKDVWEEPPNRQKAPKKLFYDKQFKIANAKILENCKRKELILEVIRLQKLIYDISTELGIAPRSKTGGLGFSIHFTHIIKEMLINGMEQNL